MLRLVYVLQNSTKISPEVLLYPLLSIVNWDIGYCKTSRKFQLHTRRNKYIFCSRLITIFGDKNLTPDL